MTFLELVKAVRSRVGMQGTGPASVTSATTFEMDLVNSVSDAWIDIQNFRENWKWMRTTTNFIMTASKTTYTLTEILGPNNRHKRWLKNTVFVEENGAKRPVRFLEYDVFEHKFANEITPTRVSYFTIVPWDDSLKFNLPDDNYIIYVDYEKSAQFLVNNEDIPEMPVEFHLLVVYAAVEKFSTVVITPEIQQLYSQQYVTMLGQLLRNQLPSKRTIIRGIA